MSKVFKYPIHDRGDGISLQIPRGARLLAFQYQNGVPCLWAEVDPDAVVETRKFHIVGTGHELPEDFEYVGTIQEPPFVWHLYQDVPR